MDAFITPPLLRVALEVLMRLEREHFRDQTRMPWPALVVLMVPGHWSAPIGGPAAQVTSMPSEENARWGSGRGDVRFFFGLSAVLNQIPVVYRLAGGWASSGAHMNLVHSF